MRYQAARFIDASLVALHRIEDSFSGIQLVCDSRDLSLELKAASDVITRHQQLLNQAIHGQNRSSLFYPVVPQAWNTRLRTLSGHYVRTERMRSRLDVLKGLQPMYEWDAGELAGHHL